MTQLQADKALASDCPPFLLHIARPVAWAELPWLELLLRCAAAAAAAWALAACQRQRQRQRQGQGQGQGQATRCAQELLRLGHFGRLNALGELAAGMAHELNQPLTAVLAGTQAVQRLLDDVIAERRQPAKNVGNAEPVAETAETAEAAHTTADADADLSLPAGRCTPLRSRRAALARWWHACAAWCRRPTPRRLARAGEALELLDQDRCDAVTIAAVADDEETLRTRLALGASARLVTSRHDGTALIAAAHLGHEGVVRQLIQAGAPLDHVNNLHYTTAIEAVVPGDGVPAPPGHAAGAAGRRRWHHAGRPQRPHATGAGSRAGLRRVGGDAGEGGALSPLQRTR